MPPVAARVAEYAAPTCPFGNEDVVMASATGLIVIVRLADCDSLGLLESVTLKVSAVLVTAVVGAPVMAPLVAFRFKPAGRVPLVSDHV